MKHRPGDIVPLSGIYNELNPAGIKVDQVTNIKGHVFPPSLGHGYYYTLHLAAKHRTLEK
jgi:hypothetical protein